MVTMSEHLPRGEMVISSDDEAFEGLTAEQHREAMEHIKAEFDRLKAVQHREILDRIDRRIRAIQQGKDPEFKEAAEKIEREYEEEVGLLERRRDYETAAIQAEMAGEKQAAAQSCEEEKRLLVSLLSEAYEQQKTEAKLRKLRKCAMIDPTKMTPFVPYEPGKASQSGRRSSGAGEPYPSRKATGRGRGGMTSKTVKSPAHHGPGAALVEPERKRRVASEVWRGPYIVYMLRVSEINEDLRFFKSTANKHA